MGLFRTKIKDKDLLDIVVLLKQIQKTRDETARDSLLQTSVENASWYRTTGIRARLDTAVKKLNKVITYR